MKVNYWYNNMSVTAVFEKMIVWTKSEKIDLIKNIMKLLYLNYGCGTETI